MEKILKQYDDMRIMRMIKKQLINTDKALEKLKDEYNEKDDQLLSLGVKQEITERFVNEEEIIELKNRLKELEKEIKDLEEDKSKLLSYNAYMRR